MTTTKEDTIQRVLSKANANDLADALRALDIGKMLAVVKVAFAALAGAADHDITDAAHKAAATISGIDLDVGENLPPIGELLSLRVTTATTGTFVGTYILTDVAGDMLTAATHTVVGVARISDDGKTITFPVNNVTGFILQYKPRAAVALTAAFAEAAP